MHWPHGASLLNQWPGGPIVQHSLDPKLELAWIHLEYPVGPSPVPIAQNLTTLIIRDSIVDENVLRILLRGTPHLEVLE